MVEATTRIGAHVVVLGRVQGVGYRWFARDRARRLGLDGWVRNLRDGRVELQAIGERPDLVALTQQLRRGPSAAHVTDVEITWLAAGECDAAQGFEILATA